MSNPERPLRLSAADAAELLLAAQRAGETAVMMLVVADRSKGEGGTTEKATKEANAEEEIAPRSGVGRRLLLTGGRVTGSLGEEALDEVAVTLAQRVLQEGLAEGTHVLAPGSGREFDVYVELHAPPPELVIVGAGHIARPLSSMGALLGFSVVILDDRPDFAAPERFPEAERVERVDFSDPFATVPLGRQSHLVLVTRGHKYDYECLRHALAVDPQPAYIGMIGSRRRVRATFVQLLREGFPRERVADIRAPVGLDLGAQSPAEIAVSVAAEIILLRGQGSGRPLRELERVVERFLPEDVGEP